MKKFLDIFFSMSFSGTLIALFAVAVGVATFIENDFGTPAAQAVVYKALWFEIMLSLLSISMLGKIFKQKMYRIKQLPSFLFHISFVIILLGAGVTRYIGFETTMPITEGETTNKMLSDETYIEVKATLGEKIANTEKKVLFTELNSPSYSEEIAVGGKEIRLRLKEFVPNAAETIQEDENGAPLLSLVVSGGNGRHNAFLKHEGERKFDFGSLRFNMPIDSSMVNFRWSDGTGLQILSPAPIHTLSMATQARDTLLAGVWHPFGKMMLYQAGNTAVVLQKFYKKASVKLIAAKRSEGSFQDALVFELTSGTTVQKKIVYGGDGYRGIPALGDIDGISYRISYGAKHIELPFSIRLVDFQLDRYPGSNSPSSYASDIELVDTRNNSKFPFRIFMNNVLDYDGYRFFQASYPPDESGTILSVNHDRWGTWITYLGYFLMTLGMLVTIFNKWSRFQQLAKKTEKIRKQRLKMGVITLFMLVPFVGTAQEKPTKLIESAVSYKHARNFGRLLTQDNGGRVKPVNTMSSELLRKIYRSDKFEGLHADQVLLEMISRPRDWQHVKLIKLSHPEMQKIAGVTGKYASFTDFVDHNERNGYKLSEHVEAAYNKKPAYRNKFDKEVIAVDERVNIAYMIFSSEILRVFPLPGDTVNNKWYASKDAPMFSQEDAVFVKGVLPMYFGALDSARVSNNYSQADKTLEYLGTFQKEFGKKVLPSEGKISLEIKYNDWNIFDRLWKFYFLLGFILLIFNFVRVLRPKFSFKWISLGLMSLIFLLFFVHTVGLGMRWYISEHAPWSNGYESMIYIGWATMLAGFLFVKRSPITVSATAVLTALILMVAHLSWMDPEITNLVPVLKSYWLTIHVAIITASYGFLALGALMGFLSLILFNLKTEKNHKNLDMTISELSVINEMTLQVGLFFLTIGTFLGGVWANESWGRYWGWDPKETWALVTVLVYAFVLHMRMIPGLKGKYAFNFMALVSFASVIMTYFGVNYYLAGLHSYAKGDPVPVPSFVYYTLIVVFSVSLMGWLNERKARKFES